MMTWLFALDNGPPCFSKLAFLSFFFYRFYRMNIQTNGGLRIVMESRDNGGRCYFRVLSNMKSVFFKVYDISTILVGNSLLSHHHLTLRKFHIKKPKGKKKILYKRTKKYLSCFLNFFFFSSFLFETAISNNHTEIELNHEQHQEQARKHLVVRRQGLCPQGAEWYGLTIFY